MLRSLITAAVLSSFAAFAAAPELIHVEMGASKTIDVGEYSRLAISHPTVAAVTASEQPGHLTISGRVAGKTTLLVWQKKGGRVPYLIEVANKAASRNGPTTATGVSLLQAERKVLSLPPIKRIAIGDPSIADARLLGKSELEVVGNSSGATTLLIWLEDDKRLEYELRVDGSNNVTRPAVTVRVGGKQHLEFNNVRRIALADPEVAHVELGARQSLDIVGKREGKTTLIVWYGDDTTRFDYEVTVTP